MFAIKRKEAVAQAVQRSARERLDRMLGELSAEPVRVERVLADARRLLALLALVSSGMDRLALQRERRALRRVIRRLEAGLEVGSALSEVRMRAGYWHVGSGVEEWAVLGAGLRMAYGRARRRVLNHGSATAEVLVALRELSDQCRWLERMWPGVLGAQRERLLGWVKSGELVEPGEEGEEAAWREVLVRESGALFVETPGVFVKRHGGYWGAWRGVGGG